MSTMTISILASTFPSPKPSINSIPFRRTTALPIQCCNFSTDHKKFGVFSFGRRNIGFVVNSSLDNGGRGDADSSSSTDGANDAEKQARGDSTMPERFRYLTKEAPDPPVRWPYYVALVFLIYAWRTVLWELYNWKNTATSILGFLGYLSKLALALIFHLIGDPLTSTIRAIETTLYTLRAFYSRIVAYAPIPELTTVIILASAILAIGEVASPNSFHKQRHLLTIAGLIGYLGVRGTIGDLVFWTFLFGLFSFSHFVKKRDYVMSVMPLAAVLAGVGEPWVRVVVIGAFLSLSIVQYSKRRPEEEGDDEGFTAPAWGRNVPVPLLCAALAIGVRVAAKWAGYRHLTWMVV